MSQRIPGRHRAPSRLTVASTTLTRSAKATAVAATSGGLLAAAVVPASAAPGTSFDDVSALAGKVSVASLPANPADEASIDALAVSLPSVTVPTDKPVKAKKADADTETDFGALGFVGVAPVEPEPEVEVVEEEASVETESTDFATTATTEDRESTSGSRDEVREAAPATPEPAPEPEPAPAPEPEPAPAPPATGGVTGIAAQYVGYSYVSGGSSPATGFDCSGFTSYVFAQVGISLPRTAAAQQAYATPVSNPQPGDLVFWGYPAYHVGIYAGNGMVYDAGNPSVGVTYRSVFSGVSGYGRVG